MNAPAKRRLAFVDLMFSWPPHGGADVDVYETAAGLQALGYEVCLFYAGESGSWERGCIDAPLPFPAQRVDIPATRLEPRAVAAAFRADVDAWRPDVVVLCHGFFLKPFIAQALAHYPLIGRYYAYEFGCPRDALLFKNGATCPNDYVRTPNLCRRCTLAHLKPRIRQDRMVAWTHEYLSCAAFMPGYYRRLTGAASRFRAIIVSNELMRAQFNGLNDHVHIFPGGVHAEQFGTETPTARADNRKLLILMSGRADEPAKGLDTLRAAGALLAKERADFEVWATHTNLALSSGWFKAIGWHSRDALIALHRQAAVCVVPSIWDEPFGLAALEAMAAGKPLCATRAGGLQHIIRDGETGFLFCRGDAAELAQRLGQLLCDPALRHRMGEAGRRLVEEKYDWPRLIETYWPPLIERILT